MAPTSTITLERSRSIQQMYHRALEQPEGAGDLIQQVQQLAEQQLCCLSGPAHAYLASQPDKALHLDTIVVFKELAQWEAAVRSNLGAYRSSDQQEPPPTWQEATLRILAFMQAEDKTRLRLPDFPARLPRAQQYPDIFSHPSFGQLKSLSLMDALGENSYVSIQDLPCLEELNLSSNSGLLLRKTVLRNLPTLKFLGIAWSLLEEIPPSFFHPLTSLEILDLSNNCLDWEQEEDREVHDHPLAPLTNLKKLYLGGNYLRFVPQVVTTFHRLVNLGLQSNHLDSCDIDLSGLSFGEDPDVEGQSINLRHNPHLVDINPSFFPPRQNYTLHLFGTGATNAALEADFEERRAGGFAIPTVEYSKEYNESTLQSLLEKFSLQSNRTETVCLPKSFNDDEKRAWFQWACRLQEVCYYAETGGYDEDFSSLDSENLANRIFALTEKTEQNPSAKEAFFAGIHDAENTCGDGAILSILQLDLYFQLQELKEQQKPALRRMASLLINGFWTIDLLGDIAKRKIHALQTINSEFGCDPIETYLTYPIFLAKNLRIPISFPMMFQRHSEVSEDDLQEAQDEVLNKRKNPEQVFAYLIRNDNWVEAMSKHTDQVANLKEQRMAALEDLEDEPSEKIPRLATTKSPSDRNEAYLSIQKDYENGLKRLTARFLLPK